VKDGSGPDPAWLHPYAALEIDERRVGHRLVLCAAGEVDIATVDALRTALARGAQAGVAEVWLDLTDVAFMDSTGLTAVLQAHRDGVPRLALICPDGPVRRLLEIAGFDRLVPIHASRSAAQ
jgi:anti-sigma B factor antagonist